MVVHTRKLKLITFTIAAVSFECQIANWQFDPGIPDGEQIFTFCPDGAAIEDGEPSPTLQLTFLSDWRANGISDYLTANSGTDAAFVLDHHPDIAAEHVRWTGTVRVKAPPVGGEARTTERTEITLQCVGEPVYARVP